MDLSMLNSLICPFVSEEVLLPYLKVEFRIQRLLLHVTQPILNFYSHSLKSKVFVKIPNTLKIEQNKKITKIIRKIVIKTFL